MLIQTKSQAWAKLTHREIEVAERLLLGQSNQTIADALEIAIGTVKNYTSLIYAKSQVSNRVDFILKFAEKGQ
jgi:two-component system response regulator DesR